MATSIALWKRRFFINAYDRTPRCAETQQDNLVDQAAESLGLQIAVQFGGLEIY
jgi:hypothetical protein